ncbi:MAG TPA: poly(R)-hydroxyalkanoic acid synthase subunit PhaE [Chiayiivirga sp.]|nr:poly(R)-hydroxyalkanoic acid synthase subunit PhaE [Chiayiivirga sp.]
MDDIGSLNFDAWLRPLREAMANWQGAAPTFSPGFNPAGFAPLSGAGLGSIPGFASAHPFGQASGPFSALFEQLATLAQGQWQQLAAGLAAGGTADASQMNWRGVLESLAPMLGAADGLGGALPGMGAPALREALSTPQVGPMREHVERWQQAMLAQLDHQDAARAFSAQLGEIMKRALEQFGQRLTARHAAGKAASTMREVFDEWIEAGEAAWAERASGDAFVAALGAYTNTQLRVRAALADQINRIAAHLGLPTRDEVDADHRRIAQLEREVRRLQREAAVPTTRAAHSERVATAASLAPATKNAQPATTKPRSVKAKSKPAPAKPTRPAKAAGTPRAVTTKASQPIKAGLRRAKSTSKPGRTGGSKAFPLVAAPRAIGKATRSSAVRTNARITP